MFVDYYEILGIKYSVTSDEIKSAYRKLSMKWHPDRNQGRDTTDMMKLINEAYYTLKDNERRSRYDAEYALFYEQKRSSRKGSYHYEYEYDIKDERVYYDMEEAKRNAKKLVDEFMSTFTSSFKDAAKGAWNESKGIIYLAIISSVIAMIYISFFM